MSSIYFTLTCSGSASTGKVTLSNAFEADIASNTTIKFTINSLFSPPTVEPGLDRISITTMDGQHSIDTLSAYVEGLTAKTSSLAITSGNTLTVNRQVTLIFTFTLPDAISQADTIAITFPTGTSINYITKFCPQLNLTNGVFTSPILSFSQSPSSPIVPAQTAVSLTFASYQVPPSTAPTAAITLSILNNGYLKMSCSSTLTPTANTYIGTVTTTDPSINSLSSYSLSFTMSDGLTSTGYFVVTLPSLLYFPSSNISVSITGTAMNSAPTAVLESNSTLKISSLNTSSSAISPQTVKITFSGVKQPSSVVSLSSSAITVKTYYSASNDQVGVATGSLSSIVLTPGSIAQPVSLTSTSTTTSQQTTLTFSMVLANALDSSSHITFSVPSEIAISSNGSICTVQNTASVCTIDTGLHALTIKLNTAINQGQSVSVSYSGFVNPPSTAPTATAFGISTYNSVSNLVDVLAASTLTYQAVKPSALVSVSLARTSTQNNASPVSYTFTYTAPLLVTSATLLYVYLPVEVAVSSIGVTCSDRSNSTNTLTLSTCSYDSTAHAITLSYTPIALTSVIRVNGLVNPASLAPTATSARL